MLPFHFGDSECGPFEPDPVDTGVGKGTDPIQLTTTERTTFHRHRPDLKQLTKMIEIQMNNYSKHRPFFGYKTTCALVATLVASFSLSAQEKLSDEEILELPVTVVTGELWESEMIETTASVSVLSEMSLNAAELKHFDDITALIPNLTTTGGTSRARYIQIRGIGENSQFEGETPDSAVAFYIDDMDFTGLGSVGSLFDVHQVEVLRGPQAGAFGANAAGGVVRIVSKNPTPYVTGYATATAGSDSLLSAEAAVGGPLMKADPERLMFRFAMQNFNSNGFYTNETIHQDDVNGRDEFSARLKLRWNASDEWHWDATLFYANVDNGYDAFSMTNEPYTTYSDEPGRDEQESKGVSLKGSFLVGDGYRFTTKTALMQTESLYSYDADWTAASYAGYLATMRDREVLTQELRFDAESDSGDRWTVGLYFQTLSEDSDVFYRDGDPSGGEWDYGKVNVNSLYETETLAAFAQFEHTFSEQTRLVAGLRYELHSVDFDSESVEHGYYQGYLYDGRSENEDAVFGGKLTLEHDVNDDIMLFASVARGYKAGGANSSTFTSPEYPTTYDQEMLWNFETGLRTWLLEDKLSAQVTAFHLYRDEPQLRDSVGAGGFFRYLTVNGESATHSGVEAEFQWKFSKQFSVTAGLGLLDTERDSYIDPGGVVEARELANAPKYNYNLRLDYRSETGVFANLSLAGRDSYYESNSHLEKRDAMNVVNAALGYEIGNWKISVWAKNLMDAEYANRVFFFDNGEGDQRYVALADPRQVGMTVGYRF